MKLEWGTPAAVRRARQDLFDATTPRRRMVEEVEDDVTTDQINGAQLTLSAELNAEARRTWGRSFMELTDREGAPVVKAVLGRSPHLRRAFEADTGPSIISVDFPARPATTDRPREGGTMMAMSERRRDVASRFGFRESDLVDPFRASMVNNLAATEARMAASRERDAFEGEIAAVGAEMGLDPTHDYGHRCRVFSELARRGHKIAAERYGGP